MPEQISEFGLCDQCMAAESIPGEMTADSKSCSVLTGKTFFFFLQREVEDELEMSRRNL